MSWEAALTTAIRQAEYFKEKRFVWAFKSHRGGLILWTVSKEPPESTWEEAFG